MRVVSSTSEAELRKKRSQDRLPMPLRVLAANLTRIANGAGRPSDLPYQLAKCLEAFAEYETAVGRLPKDREVRAALDYTKLVEEYRPWVKEISEADRARWEADGSTTLNRAKDKICHGALQMVAAKLLDQLTQENKAESDVSDAVDAYNAAIKKIRKRYRVKK